MKIVGHKIPVQDITQAVAFYRDQLGFDVVFEAPEYGWASIQQGEAKLGLYVSGKGGGTRQVGGSIDFSFAMTDLETYHHTLKTKGVKVSDIVQSNDGLNLFDVQDPDGNDLTFRKC